MTEPQVIWRKLTVTFSRTVSFPDQTPAVLQVVVTPLVDTTAPPLGTTFVSPAGVQEVTLDRHTEIVFELVPSHLAGIAGEVLYRIQWRSGGVTGRTFSYDFAMPDQDVRFEDLADLGAIVDGEAYLRHSDLGVPGRVARLNFDGHVVDAQGNVLATQSAINTLSSQLQAEAVARQQGDQATRKQLQGQLETQINSVLAVTSASLANKVGEINLNIDAERQARIGADEQLGGRIDDLAALLQAHDAAMAAKADLVDGRVPLEQIPDAARTTVVQVPSQAAMLALTPAQVQRYDFVSRPDGVWVLIDDDPSKLSSWVQVNKVSSVNGKQGTVTLNLSEVAAQGGSIAIGQVQGLTEALAAAGDAEAVEELMQRLEAIEADPTIVRLADGVISHTLLDDHVAYIADGRVVDKAGNIITVPGTGSVTSVNGRDGEVVIDLSDVAAQGGTITIGHVDGLQELLDGLDAAELLDILAANGITAESNLELRIQALELGGGSGGGLGVPKGAWFDGPDGVSGIADPADFRGLHGLRVKSPFSRRADGTYTYSPGGIAPLGETYVYPHITRNGHLELREWNEDNPPDPEPATAEDLEQLVGVVATKADQEDLDLVAAIAGAKADRIDLLEVIDILSTKANTEAVTTLAATVAGKASQADMAAALTAIEALQTGKASLTSGGTVPLAEIPTLPVTKISGLQDTLAAKADLVGGKVPTAQVPDLPIDRVTGLQTALAAKADLVGGKIPTSQLPSIAITNVTTVPNLAAMLAQTTSQVQRGDITIVTATSDRGNYILAGDDPSVLANWVKLTSADGGAVSSVNGQIGDVVLSAADVGARSAADPIAISDVANLQAVLDTKVSQTALTSGLASKVGAADVQAMLSASAPVKIRVARVATSPVASMAGSQVIDGAIVGPGTLVLLTAQSSSVNNGVWMVQSGSWTRPAEFANGAYLARGTIVFVAQGTQHADTIWQQTSASGVIGTNANNWERIGHTAPPYQPVAGSGITIEGGTTFRVQPAASGGITVTSQGVAIDTTRVPRKAWGYITGQGTVFSIAHNLGTEQPIVQIIESASGNVVLAGITITGPNTFTVEFASPPANNQYRWVAIG